MSTTAIMTGGEEQQPPRSFWSRWIGVYFSPVEAFQDIARKPDFIYPLLVIALSAITFTETMLAKVGMERIIRNSIELSGKAAKMSAEQIQQAVDQGKVPGSIIAHVAGVVGAPIYLLIVAVVGLVILNGIFGSPVSFKKAFAVTCYANLCGFLGALMALVMILFGDLEHFNPENAAPTNVGFFLNPLETPKALLTIASSFDLFTLWFVVLLGIGFSQAADGKVKARTITLVYIGLWVIWVLGKVGLGAVFS